MGNESNPEQRNQHLQKLEALLIQALHVPKKRKKTKISKNKKRENLHKKRKHSEKKRMRARFDVD